MKLRTIGEWVGPEPKQGDVVRLLDGDLHMIYLASRFPDGHWTLDIGPRLDVHAVENQQWR